MAAATLLFPPSAGPVGEPPSTAELTTFLLHLHEQSHELGYRDLLQYAFRCLDRLIPFKVGLLAACTVRDGIPFVEDLVFDERTSAERSAAFVADWDSVKHEDNVARWAFEHPGATGNFPLLGPMFDGCEGARAKCRAWGLEQILITSKLVPSAGLYWVVTLYRSDPATPFTEAERQAVELLIPHVLTAARQARLGHLRASTRIVQRQGQAGAIANEDGLVLEAEPDFPVLLAEGWKAWRGPHLPFEMRELIAQRAPARVMRGRVVVRIDPADGLVLLHARRAIAADSLTRREREIAEAFALGESYRALSERFQIAPNTIRRHLANIYEKLGISSKAELERMVRDF